MTILLVSLALLAMAAPPAWAIAWELLRQPAPWLPGLQVTAPARHTAYRTTLLLGDCCLCIGPGHNQP
jgi:hypothetical protein